MDEQLIERVTKHALSHPTPWSYTIASEGAINETESILGFRLPEFLRACYLKIGNGGFGPGYGIIGVQSGHESDFGNLVETLKTLKEGREWDGYEWPQGLLPFLNWGCNIYSCVDCLDSRHPVYTSEECVPRLDGFSFDKFFDLWIEGVCILDYQPPRAERIDIMNPFTKKKSSISKRRPS